MKPAPFQYERPASLGEALDMLQRFQDRAKPIAGGQSLVPMLNMRIIRPEVLVDLAQLDLTHIQTKDGRLVLGALVRHAQVERDDRIREAAPLLSYAAQFIAGPAVRHRGTLGGSLAQADPAAELAVAAVALDAVVEVASRTGQRAIPIQEFFLGPYMTVLDPTELVVAVHFPVQSPAERWGFYEICERAGDFALAAAAVRLWVEDGRIGKARVVAAGGGLMPTVVRSAEEALAGQRPGLEVSERAARAGAADLRPFEDEYGSAEFRRELLRVAVERALRQAFALSAGVREGRPWEGRP